ncbi:MAG: glucose-1-phosphate adenylyltransferase [Planctomycetaceae bacterium]|nr:glucose-1-phosphate adenylyltransferase [Planctomycetaceae bacterium]
MNDMVCLILGGGKGTRLQPLTSYRSKPAVPLGGKYRLIDIPISNCLNSGIRRIYLLTQFNSVSLHRHIRQTYVFDPFSGGFVEILAAQQTNETGTDWYQGTADAVRKQLRYIQQPGVKYVLILSGDQLYQMDFREMLKTHQESEADVTIAALPVTREKANGFGIMRLSDSGRVEGFLEKPKTDSELSMVRTDPAWIDAQGIPSHGRQYLASMGIYLFNRDVLVRSLETTTYQDFGKEIFPASIRAKHVQVHLFDGYWEDIGTINAFYEANLALVDPNPPFRFDDESHRIFTRPRYLPATRIDGAMIKRSLVADGCRIEAGAQIEHSLIGLRTVIGENATVRNSVVMGADFYRTPDDIKTTEASSVPPVGIGAGSQIEGAIVDKNCRIGKNVTVRLPDNFPQNGEHGPLVVNDGIIVIPKNAVLPDGWTFGG